MSLSAADQVTFCERGILLLPQALPKSEAAAVERVILSELDRLKLRAKGKIMGAKIQSLPLFQQTGRLAQMVEVGSSLDRLFPDALVKSMNLLQSGSFALRLAR